MARKPIRSERTTMKTTKRIFPAMALCSAILLAATLAVAATATATRYLHVKVTNPTSR